MFNFITKFAAHNDALIALAPVVVSLGLMYCWVVTISISTMSIGLNVI